MASVMTLERLGAPSVFASVSAGVRGASALAASAAARIVPVAPIALRDTAEFSAGARSAGEQDIAQAAVETKLAKVQMQAMAAVVKAEERMNGALLDVLG